LAGPLRGWTLTSIYAYFEHWDTSSVAIDTSIYVGVAAGFQSETTTTNNLHNWKKKHPNGIFEYDFMNGGEIQSPFFSLDYLNNQAKRINTTNTLGSFYETNWGVYVSAMYMTAFHKSLNDGSDVQTNFNVYVNDMFPGSKTKIKELFNHWTNENNFLSNDWLTENKNRLPLYLSLINEAANLSGGAEETHRIEQLKAYVHYLILHYDLKATDALNSTGLISRRAKADILLDYLVSVYNYGIINSFQAINNTVSDSLSVSQATFDKWVDTTGNGPGIFKAAPLLAVSPINSTKINSDFTADTTAYPMLATYKFTEPDSIIAAACKMNLVPLDSINFYLNGYYNGSVDYEIKSTGASSIRIYYKKNPTDINKRINFVLDSKDQMYSVAARSDSITQNGFVDLAIPAAGNYKMYILIPKTAQANISIIANNNFVYHGSPIYSNGIAVFKDSISAPRYIYVPKGLNKLYISLYYSHSDTTQLLKKFKFTNAQGDKPKIYIEPSDSNLYYFNVDSANAGKFWQLYADTAATAEIFSIVNTQNVHLYLQQGFCSQTSIAELDKIDFSIYPNPSTGVFSLMMKADGLVKISVLNMMGQNIYSQQYDKWNGTQDLDLSSLPMGMYFVKIENKHEFSTKKIVITK